MSEPPTSEPVVVVEGLTKLFGDVKAVDDLSFTVERGQVCGMLGPNGAGKTTSLRILMGLERANAGSVALFGTRIEASSPVLSRVGAMVEQAAFVPHLSGMTNLQLWWRAAGTPMRDADLDGALAIAGLGDAVNRAVKTYSQGMKQRLGFARLLLGRPELLVLDEPTNGLDPGEIREIRELLARLTDQGATVLLSSHHLSEVEQTCSHVVVMNRGALVRRGTVRELVGANRSAYVEVDDRDAATRVLLAVPGVTAVRPQGDGLVVEQRNDSRADLAAALVGAGLQLETLSATQGLEDAFLELLEPQPVTAPAETVRAR